MSDGQEAKPSGRDRNWDAFAAVIAAFIGLLALMVSAYTAKLQREQVRAQVWPRLLLSRSQERHIAVTNNGIGPARVRAVRMAVDGRAVKTWADLLVALGHKPEHFGYSTLKGAVIPPGQQVEAFTAHDNEAGRALFAEVFRNQEPRIAMLVCYCSVLDQCWLASNRDDVDADREIDACPIAQADRFTE
jgi:hypothetical protein